MKKLNLPQWIKRFVAGGGIVVFFIMAFEVMIMISPFAFFFYSVFNPFLHWLDNFTATRWLTALFLPHMILHLQAKIRSQHAVWMPSGEVDALFRSSMGKSSCPTMRISGDASN